MASVSTPFPLSQSPPSQPPPRLRHHLTHRPRLLPDFDVTENMETGGGAGGGGRKQVVMRGMVEDGRRVGGAELVAGGSREGGRWWRDKQVVLNGMMERKEKGEMK